MVKSARGTRRHPRVRFDDEAVDRMRKLIAAGMSYGDVASLHKTSKGTVFDIVRGRRRSEAEYAPIVSRSEQKAAQAEALAKWREFKEEAQA